MFRNAFKGNVAIDIYGVEMLLLENSVMKMYVEFTIKLPLRRCFNAVKRKSLTIINRFLRQYNKDENRFPLLVLDTISSNFSYILSVISGNSILLGK
jgi:hypothetical protein